MRQLRYLRYLVRHIYWTWVYGRRLGIQSGWRHDWSKFRPSEWRPYRRYFYPGDVAGSEQRFNRAWLLHIARNKHHWQHYIRLRRREVHCGPESAVYGDMRNLARRGPADLIEPWKAGMLREDDGEWLCLTHDHRRQVLVNPGSVELLPMPDRHRREMLADWQSVGRVLRTAGVHAWYAVNKDRMLLHPETRAWVEDALRTLVPVEIWRTE